MKKTKKISEFEKFGTTKTSLINSKNVISYIIGGRKYNFAIPEDELYEETPYAYCITLDKWAWLYENAVYFKGECMIPAQKI